MESASDKNNDKKYLRINGKLIMFILMLFYLFTGVCVIWIKICYSAIISYIITYVLLILNVKYMEMIFYHLTFVSFYLFIICFNHKCIAD